MTTDRIAERQELDDQIAAAQSADARLTDLERKRAELPALQREQRRRELQEASDAEMATATATARALLDEAGTELAACRREFTAICAAVRELATDLAEAERKIYQARAVLTEPVRAAVSVDLHDDRRSGFDRDRAVAVSLAAAFGETWSGVGGDHWNLAPFPDPKSRLEREIKNALVHEARRAMGQQWWIYHPGQANQINPFQ